MIPEVQALPLQQIILTKKKALNVNHIACFFKKHFNTYEQFGETFHVPSQSPPTVQGYPGSSFSGLSPSKQGHSGSMWWEDVCDSSSTSI